MDRSVRTVALCAAMQGVGGGLGWSLLPPLMPNIARDLGISHAMGGLVWGSASLGIAVASPLGGAAVDRWGARRVAGVAMFIGALACALRAVAWNSASLAVLMLLFGAHVGFVAPAIPKALVSDVPATKLGRANGIAILCYTLGTALSVLTARTVLMPLFGGWRATMIAAGMAMAITGGAWLLLLGDRGVKMPHANLRDVLALSRFAELRRIGVIHFLLFGGYLALLGLLPRTLAERGLPLTRVGIAVAAWLVVAAVANFVGPTLSDRIGRRKPFIVIGSVVAGLSLALFALAPNSPILFLCLAAVGGGCFAPLLLAMPAEIEGIGPQRAGAALGFLMLIGQAGGFILPALAGAALQARGFSAAIGLLSIAHLAILLPALGLRGPATKKAETASPLPA